jgi:3',5'-cyclic AMP phosphodiesterase CpdA
MPPKPLKFVVIADAHIGATQTTKPPTRFPERAKSLLRYLISKINGELEADFVVQLGDLIEADDAEEDEDNLSTAADIFRDLKSPVYHVVGNHDQANLPPKTVCTILKMPGPFYSFQSGRYHCLVLFSEKNDDRWSISKAQLKWLEQELAATDKQVLVFSHFPLVDAEVDEAAEIEPPIELENRADVRNLLVQSGKVRAVFSGHWHKNSFEEVGGINYISVQSLVQNISRTGSTVSESFAVVKMFEDRATIEIEGMDPAEFRF